MIFLIYFMINPKLTYTPPWTLELKVNPEFSPVHTGLALPQLILQSSAIFLLAQTRPPLIRVVAKVAGVIELRLLVVSVSTEVIEVSVLISVLLNVSVLSAVVMALLVIMSVMVDTSALVAIYAPVVVSSSVIVSSSVVVSLSVELYVSGVVTGAVTGVVSGVVFGSAVVSVVVMLALVVLSWSIDVPSVSASVFVDCSIVDVRFGCVVTI